MASDVEICNLAMRQLGANRITALTDDIKEARECNDVFALMRDEVLRMHPWNFATERVSLAADTTDPVWGFDKRFRKPADCLRVLEVQDYDDWKMEGNFIHVNDAGPIFIRYVKQVTDTQEFDAIFVSALAARIAFELVESLTESNTKKEAAAQRWDTWRLWAASADAQEGTADLQPDGSWLESRR